MIWKWKSSSSLSYFSNDLTCLPASLLCKLTIRTMRRRVIELSCSSTNDWLTLRPNFKSSEQPPHSKPSLIDGRAVLELIVVLDNILDLKATFDGSGDDDDDESDGAEIWFFSQPHSDSSPLAQALATLCITEADVSA